MIKFKTWTDEKVTSGTSSQWGDVTVSGWTPYVIWLRLSPHTPQGMTIISTPTGGTSLWKRYNDLLEQMRNEMMIPSTRLGLDRHVAS